MASILLAAPAAEPLTLAEAKQYLRVEHGDDDAVIGSLIVGARRYVEDATRRALIAQTWRFIFDAWPRDGRLTLAIAPLQEVLAARVYDADNIAHAIDVESFVIDRAAAPGVIGFPPWAMTAPGRALAGVELDVEAGYGEGAADVPEPLRQAMRLLLAHWYEQRELNGESGAPRAPAGFAALIAPYRAVTL